MQAQRPAPPIPTMRKEVTTPEMTPSPTLKPEIRMDNEISPMKPLPPPSENRRPFSYEGPGEAAQGSPQQREQEPKQQEKAVSSPAKEEIAQQAALPLRTTSLDPPEPSPSVRPMTAPAPQSTFSTTHPSLSTHALPSETEIKEAPFVPLTDQSIPLPLTLIPRITPSQLSCYTQHATSVWSNNVFQPMGCMVCHSNEKERKFSCTWCQLRICRGCSEKLVALPGRSLGRLLKMEGKEGKEDGGFRVVVEDVDFEDEVEEWEQDEEEDMEMEEERGGRGRNMMKGGSRARNQVVTPRE